jgi:small subunit ribosomal protein S8
MTIPNDPIADFLTRLRNANMRRKEHFDIPASNMKLALSRILKDEGFIRHYKHVPEKNKAGSLRVYLKFGPTGERVIQRVTRVSTPGCRKYVGAHQIPFVQGGLGVSIISTSQGVMTGKQARKAGMGGEMICQVQ